MVIKKKNLSIYLQHVKNYTYRFRCKKEELLRGKEEVKILKDAYEEIEYYMYSKPVSVFEKNKGYGKVIDSKPEADVAKEELTDVNLLRASYERNEALSKRLEELKNRIHIRVGKEIVENRKLSFGGFASYKFSIPFNWDIDPYQSRTWLCVLHQFRFITAVLAYDVRYSSIEGFRICESLIRSWTKSYIYSDKVEPAWHDHTTALRARHTFILLLYCLDNYNKLLPDVGNKLDSYISFLCKFLQTHILVLKDRSFYSKGTNHGFDQSIALYELTAFLDFPDLNRTYNKKAASRIVYEISKAFTKDGAHSENSPKYLLFGLKQMCSALSLTKEFPSAAKISIKSNLLDKATRVLTHFIKPNGMLPIIGDTVNAKVDDFFSDDIRPSQQVYQEFIYAQTEGNKGTPSKQTDLILEKGGYAVFRDKWHSKQSISDSTHLILKSGFLSRYHRHDDDTSIVLYAHGEDWLIDSGLYKYEENDPYRRYMRSSIAHNLSVPYGIVASRNIVRVRSKLKAITVSDEKVIVKAKSKMFIGFKVIRNVEHNKKTNTFILKDYINPSSLKTRALIDKRKRNNATTYATRFHIPKDKLLEVSGGLIRIIGKTKQLLIKVHAEEGKYRVAKYFGAVKPQIIGWTSSNSGSLDKTNVIEIQFFQKKLDVSYELIFEDR